MRKAKDRNHMPGYEVDECEETVKRLLSDLGSVASDIHSFALLTRHGHSDEDEWDWGTAGMLSAALNSLKDVCRLLGIEN